MGKEGINSKGLPGLLLQVPLGGQLTCWLGG